MSEAETLSDPSLFNFTYPHEEDPYKDWIDHELKLGLKSIEGKLYSQTPLGKKLVEPTLINGVRSIYFPHPLTQRPIATHVPHLRPDIHPRLSSSESIHFKLWGTLEITDP